MPVRVWCRQRSFRINESFPLQARIFFIDKKSNILRPRFKHVRCKFEFSATTTLILFVQSKKISNQVEFFRTAKTDPCYSSLLQNALTPTQNTFQGATPGLFGNLFSSLSGGAATGYGQQWGQNMAGNGLKTNISPDNGAGAGAGWDNMFRQQGAV